MVIKDIYSWSTAAFVQSLCNSAFRKCLRNSVLQKTQSRNRATKRGVEMQYRQVRISNQRRIRAGNAITFASDVSYQRLREVLQKRVQDTYKNASDGYEKFTTGGARTECACQSVVKPSINGNHTPFHHETPHSRPLYVCTS